MSIHFIGIGGAGMSGLAKILLQKKENVSGSDAKKSKITDSLRKNGARIYIGHKKENVAGAKLIVFSSAIDNSNPEIKEAKRQGIKIVHRSQMLEMLMRDKRRIIITGSHGKTTTTSMISLVLKDSGADPAFAIGGEVKNLGGNAGTGKGRYFVAEGDESDGSFLRLKPDVAVVTNIEPEHLDHYRTFKNLIRAFKKFLSSLPADGYAILNADDKVAGRISKSNIINKDRMITYGIKNKAFFTASGIKLIKCGSEFDIIRNGKKLGKIRLSVPGMHNISNSLAAVASALAAGVKFEKIKKALKKFKGAGRRFEIKGEEKGIIVIDDYAHHPSEIAATISAAKCLKRQRIIAIFQPHRYSRTRLLGMELGRALSPTDIIILTKIYSAGEKEIKGISSLLVLEGIEGRQGIYIPEKEKVVSTLLNIIRKGDLVITMGAGDVHKIGEEFLKKLRKR